MPANTGRDYAKEVAEWILAAERSLEGLRAEPDFEGKAGIITSLTRRIAEYSAILKRLSL